MQFTWDQKKAISNRRKHEITFEGDGSFFRIHTLRSSMIRTIQRWNKGRSSSEGRKTVSCWSVSPNDMELSVSLALAEPLHEKENAMKKTKGKTTSGDVRDEYAFDYSTAKPNRFASMLKQTSVVVLDSDVAAVFTSSKAVNSLLRSAIRATGKAPAPTKKKTAPLRGRRRAA